MTQISVALKLNFNSMYRKSKPKSQLEIFSSNFSTLILI